MAGEARDFFEAQDSARSRSRLLVILFVLAVIAIIASIYAVVHFALGPGPQGPVDFGLLIIVAVLTVGMVTAGSTVRTMQLRQGGPKVAEMLGGRRVRPNTTDEAERRLVNVVEEMAIASGTPVPAIYVLDHETGINAFAAGYTLDDAAVAVTRGTLEKLNRDELQGVIAHEFSHILNGDMRLNIRLMGLLFGILLLAIIGRGLLYSGGRGRRGRDGGGNQIALVGFALVIIGYIGVFFGKLIQAAVSRQREYLADAAAVQYTRNPGGIGGALQKIGGIGSQVENHHAQEASHLFFARGLGGSMFSLLATHPPLEERIRRIGLVPLDPPSKARSRGEVRSAPAGGRRGAAAGAAPVAGLAGAAAMTAGMAEAAPPGSSGVDGRALIASIGSPDREHVAYAGRLLRSLPDAVRDAAHDPDGAAALLFALLLHDEDAGVAAAQHRMIREFGDDALEATVTSLAADVAALGGAARLPLLDLLLPALRELPPTQAERVRAAAESLSAADGRTDMFELALLHVLGRQLGTAAHSRNAAEGAAGERPLDALRGEAEVVLSAVAWSGTTDAGEADAAFAAAAAHAAPLRGAALRPRDAIDIASINHSLERLRGGRPAARRQFLEACIHAVAHDGHVHVQEAELLRAVAEAIHCPMPPVAPGALS
jgi:Zn-dependent protease with chaperone function